MLALLWEGIWEPKDTLGSFIAAPLFYTWDNRGPGEIVAETRIGTQVFAIRWRALSTWLLCVW